jgi:predicted dehydrogenase
VTIRVALAGCGAWGRNLLRVLVESPRARVVAVADPCPAALAHAGLAAPGALLVASLDEALVAGVDAVLVATPSHTHAALTLRALAAGADVFVEKPLAMSPEDASLCAETAAARGRIGMVGHLLRYHPAVARLIELGRSGALGRLRRLEGERLSIGGDRTVSALWALGPHDLSVLHALDASPLRDAGLRASATGDRVLLDARLASGVEARVALSRSHPTKERRLRVVGSDAVAFFDDVRHPDRVLLGEPSRADRKRSRSPAGPDPWPDERDLPRAREVRVPWREPLAIEIDHFLRCVEERTPPLTPLEEGVLVVQALSRAEARPRPDLPAHLRFPPPADRLPPAPRRAGYAGR